MKTLTRFLTVTVTATMLAVVPFSAASAAVPGRALPSDPKTLNSAYLTDAQVKTLLKVPAMTKLGDPVSNVKNGLFTGYAKNSPLGKKYSAYSTTHNGPFLYVQSMLEFAATPTATKAEFDKISKNNAAFSNRVITKTASSIVTYKGPGSQKTTDKRLITAYVYKDGLIAGGECLAIKPTTTFKALTDCAVKTANAQWAKANPLIK